MNIICFGCGGRHKLRSDKFPTAMYETKRTQDKTGKVIGISRKLIGYLCKKCAIKKELRQEIAKDKDLQGLGWRNAWVRWWAKKEKKVEFKDI